MAYSVTFTHAAANSLEKLDRSLILRIKTKVLSLAENPRPPGSIKLSGDSELHRVRVGVYRNVYPIDDAKKAIAITIVAHRRESYRGL